MYSAKEKTMEKLTYNQKMLKRLLKELGIYNAYKIARRANMNDINFSYNKGFNSFFPDSVSFSDIIWGSFAWAETKNVNLWRVMGANHDIIKSWNLEDILNDQTSIKKLKNLIEPHL